MLNSPKLQRRIVKGGIAAQFNNALDAIRRDVSDTLNVAHDASEDADVVVAMYAGINIPAAVAAVRGIPILPIALYPFFPSREFPAPLVTTRQLGPFNHASYTILLRELSRRSVQPSIADYRLQHGLALNRKPYTLQVMPNNDPAAMMWSRHIAPMPRDYNSRAFQGGAITAPSWLRDRTGSIGPSTDLLAWIERGPPPIFISFGSMPVPDEQATVDILQSVLKELGLRGILSSGWSAFPEKRSDNLYAVKQINHQQILPLCQAAIHHGGAGTTHASVAAGLPTLICSFAFDQPYWGQRLKRLGIGDHIPFKSLSAGKLESRLRPLLTSDCVTRARAIGERVASDDGLGVAVSFIENELPGHAAPR